MSLTINDSDAPNDNWATLTQAQTQNLAWFLDQLGDDGVDRVVILEAKAR